MAAGLVFDIAYYFEEVIRILLTNDDVKESAKMVKFDPPVWKAAACAAVGGFAFGPIGAGIGGFVGSLLGSNDYFFMVEKVQELTGIKQKELVKALCGLVGSATIAALHLFLGLSENRIKFLCLIRDFVFDLQSKGIFVKTYKEK